MKATLLRECVRFALSKNTPDHHPEWGRWHHYSFVIQDKIVEFGLNRTGPPIPMYPDIAKIHAEVAAWRKAKGILNHRKPWDVVNIRLNKTGDLRQSKPCVCCMELLRTAGCRMVHYSTNTGFESITL
jgi:tRNA(Arg) A34 adenosine deaminase TadA